MSEKKVKYICYRCLAVNEEHELQESPKIKGLSHEASRAIKICKADKCKCSTFYQVAE